MEPEVNMVFETVTLSGTYLLIRPGWQGCQSQGAIYLHSPALGLSEYPAVLPHLAILQGWILAPPPWVTCTTHRAILWALVLESVAGRLICRHGSASGSDHRCLWSPHFLSSLGAVYISSNPLRDVSTLKLPLVHQAFIWATPARVSLLSSHCCEFDDTVFNCQYSELLRLLRITGLFISLLSVCQWCYSQCLWLV